MADKFLSGFLLLLLASCGYGTSERDRMEFVDSFESVQKNAVFLDSLLKLNNEKCSPVYSVDFTGDTVLIQGPRTHDKFVPGSLCDSLHVPVRQFQAVCNTLKRNGIGYVYFQSKTDVAVFGYRVLSSEEFFEIRDIIINNEHNKDILLPENRVLEKRGKLMLIQPIDKPRY